MYLTRNVIRKYYAPENEGGGGGGAPVPPPPNNDDPWTKIPADLKETVTALVNSSVASQVTGLKNKNSELIARQKELTTQLSSFEGIDPEAVRAILKRFGDDEEAALIKSGKIDEVLNKRTERLNADWNKKVGLLEGEKQRLAQKAAKLAERATSEAIIKAAQKAGALPEATEDIVLRAKGAGWTINDDGDVVATKDNEVIIGKDGKTPLSPLEWIEGVRETASHLWPRAQGSGAPGSGANGKAGLIDPSLSPEARMTLAREQQMAGARH